MPQTIETLGLLLLEGSLHETIWGGRRLAEVAGKRLPDGARVGESWETAVESLVRNGPYRGSTLGELTRSFDAALVGSRAIELFGHRFPLLTKFIDAQDQLSVQVHPNDDYAAAHENGKLGKTETWYVLSAMAGARLVYGLAHDCQPEDVRAAIEVSRLEGLLNTFEAREGDVIYVPAGTIHAIGAGIVLYELQEYSDVTYRLYDYGRLQSNGMPRELHIDKALDVMRYTKLPVERATSVEVAFSGGSGSRRILSGGRYFVLEELIFDGPASGATDGTSCHILSVLSGNCAVESSAGAVQLALGDTAVMPAALGAYHMAGERVRLLRSYVPVEDDFGLSAWRQAQDSTYLE